LKQSRKEESNEDKNEAGNFRVAKCGREGGREEILTLSDCQIT